MAHGAWAAVLPEVENTLSDKLAMNESANIATGKKLVIIVIAIVVGVDLVYAILGNFSSSKFGKLI